MLMRIGSLFSGAGALDLAVEAVFDGRTVWHCELDAAASKVLAHRWPGVPNLGDITTVDWSEVEPVDVLCGGFPCTDVSSAGRRAGMRAGTRSGLWSAFADAIDALRPKFVVIENVRGLLTADGEAWPPQVVAADVEWRRLRRIERLVGSKIRRAIRKGYWIGEYRRRKQSESYRMARRADRALARFGSQKRRLVQRAIGTVVADLADFGYDAQWTTVSAASVGAPHLRERVFILATDTHSAIGEAQRGRSGARDVGRPQPVERDRQDRTCDWPAACVGRDEGQPESARVVGRFDAAERSYGPVDLLPTPRAHDAHGHKTPEQVAVMRARGVGVRNLNETVVNELLPTPTSRDGKGPNQRNDSTCLHGAMLPQSRWGKYAAATHRWEGLTRPSPAPTEPNNKSNPRLAPPFPEWMMGWPAGWCTDPAIGISRNAQLRIIGNGVCIQQCVAALHRLLPIAEMAA